MPETRDLDSEDAWRVLRRVRYLPLLRKSMHRLGDADGYSYARAVGFQIVLATFPALIFFVGLASWTGNSAVQSSVESILTSLAPGATTDFFQQAVRQGQENARSVWPVLAGGVAALSAGMIGMSQIQQGADRLYGRDEDRPFLQRYGLGLVLALSTGLLLASGLVAITFGSGIADAVDGESIWAWLRWPAGAAAVVVGLAVLYKTAPHRPQPSVSWLIVGGLTATVLWIASSSGLALYLSLSSTFGETYGPLAGLIGFLIWAQLTGLAVFSGLAVAAELEHERATGGESGVDPAMRDTATLEAAERAPTPAKR